MNINIPWLRKWKLNINIYLATERLIFLNIIIGVGV